MIRRKVEYGLLLLGCFALHIFLVDYLSFLVLIFFLALPVISLGFMVFLGRRVTVDLDVTGALLPKEESVPLRLRVRNPAPFGACRIKVVLSLRNELLGEELTERLFLTAGTGEQNISQSLSSRYCGKIDCAIRELRAYDFLGLFSFRLRAREQQPRSLYVLPDAHPITLRPDTKIQEESGDCVDAAQLSAGNDPSEIMDFREYRAGDKMTRIHWKLSDKYDKLMVKEYGSALSDGVLLLLDFNGAGQELDGIMETLRSLSAALTVSDIPHKIQWYDGKKKCFAGADIRTAEDLRPALRRILDECKPEARALMPHYPDSAGNRRRRYSDVLYLCADFSPEDLALLRERAGSSRIQLLLVAEPERLPDIDTAPATALNIGLTTIQADDMAQSLRALAL